MIRPPRLVRLTTPSRSCGIRALLSRVEKQTDVFPAAGKLCSFGGDNQAKASGEIPQRTTRKGLATPYQTHFRAIFAGQFNRDKTSSYGQRAGAQPSAGCPAVRRARPRAATTAKSRDGQAQAATPRSNNHQATLAQLRIMTAAATAQLKTVPARKRRRRRRTALSPHLAHQEKVSHNRKLDAGLVLKAHLLLCRTADFVSQIKKSGRRHIA